MKYFLSLLITCCFIFNNSQAQDRPTIVINELMADNTSLLANEKGKFEDWIEIYNFGNEPVDIGGLYFTDDINNPKTFRIPPGNDSTIIQPKSFLVLWADDDWEDGIFHLEFKLSRKGEQVAIFGANAEVLIDSVSFGTQMPNQSWGRKTDNSGEWTVFEKPTPENPNN